MEMKDKVLIKKFTLLYVEDEEDIRNEMLKILNRFFEVIFTAQNGEEGVSLFLKHQPDMIITDLRMPVMNGMEMLRKIKEVNKEVPVIVSTAYNESGYLLDAIEMGLDKYIVKPVKLEQLLDAVLSICKNLELQRTKDARQLEIQYILDLNPSFIVLTNEGNIEYVNKTFLEFLGFFTLDQFLSVDHPLEKCMVQIEGTSCARNIKKFFQNAGLQPWPEDSVVCLCSSKDTEQKNPRTFHVKFNGIPHTYKTIFTFSDITSLEKEKLELKHVAMHDSLTGIFNRMKYDETLALEIERSRRYTFSLSLILADIDFFKRINDELGHKEGDKVLIEVARLLSQNLRRYDTIARIGGEEFAIILPESDIRYSTVVAEKLRALVEEHFKNDTKKVTLSFGIAILEDKDSGENLFIKADKALYSAKHKGRNRVEFYTGALA